jgi:hypothetical protein
MVIPVIMFRDALFGTLHDDIYSSMRAVSIITHALLCIMGHPGQLTSCLHTMCIDRPAYIKLGGRLRRHIEPFSIFMYIQCWNHESTDSQIWGSKGKREPVTTHDENSNILKT